MKLRADAPLHIREGVFEDWALWFAWRPARTEQGEWIWLRCTWRRWFYPPLWFIPPAPWRLRQISNVKRGFWELAR